MRIVENLSGVVMFLNVSLLRTNLFIFEKKTNNKSSLGMLIYLN